jgi:NAD(P)-dependent dehydrogenase (short-subunit alcohol dehydrogenase family)
MGNESMKKLEGKVAVVTGASRGIGLAIAKTLGEHGAKLVIASRKIESLAIAAETIIATGAEATAVACHMGQPNQIGELIKLTLERYGKIDILVNNAATNPHFGPLMTADFGVWDKTFEVNIKGYFAATREVIKSMTDKNIKGSIINVASILGYKAAPMQGIYAMTKAAVISFTRTLAVEIGGTGIRVNAIAPGLIDTKFSAAIVKNDTLSKMVMERTPLGRVGRPEDISAAALYLASDDSSFVTGSVITVDGGWTLG